MAQLPGGLGIPYRTVWLPGHLRYLIIPTIVICIAPGFLLWTDIPFAHPVYVCKRQEGKREEVIGIGKAPDVLPLRLTFGVVLLAFARPRFRSVYGLAILVEIFGIYWQQ